MINFVGNLTLYCHKLNKINIYYSKLNRRILYFTIQNKCNKLTVNL